MSDNKTEAVAEATTAAPEAAPAAEAAPTNGTPVTELTIGDLNAMKAIIDVASTRGAFKAAEMEMVGKTFNKLSAFLDNAAKNQEEAKGKE